MSYHFLVHEVEEWEQGFWAECLEVSGCCTQTFDKHDLPEMKVMAKEALEGILDTQLTDDDVVLVQEIEY